MILHVDFYYFINMGAFYIILKLYHNLLIFTGYPTSGGETGYKAIKDNFPNDIEYIHVDKHRAPH